MQSGGTLPRSKSMWTLESKKAIMDLRCPSRAFCFSKGSMRLEALLFLRQQAVDQIRLRFYLACTHQTPQTGLWNTHRHCFAPCHICLQMTISVICHTYHGIQLLATQTSTQSPPGLRNESQNLSPLGATDVALT